MSLLLNNKSGKNSYPAVKKRRGQKMRLNKQAMEEVLKFGEEALKEVSIEGLVAQALKEIKSVFETKEARNIQYKSLSEVNRLKKNQGTPIGIWNGSLCGENTTPTTALITPNRLMVGGYAGCCTGLATIVNLDNPISVSIIGGPSVHDIIPVKLIGEEGDYFLISGDGCAFPGYQIVEAFHTKKSVRLRLVDGRYQCGTYYGKHSSMPWSSIAHTMRFKCDGKKMLAYSKVRRKSVDITKLIESTLNIDVSKSYELLKACRRFSYDDGTIWMPSRDHDGNLTGGYIGKADHPSQWIELKL
ncbi:hypothetical protein HY636_03650 [Candidatus Woesearchaeota archaeon]|nr:hypothetical protein [Candidatus Woesearchaeota archaeon]